MNVIYDADVEDHTDCRKGWPLAGLLIPEHRYQTPLGEVGVLAEGTQGELHAIPTPLTGKNHESAAERPPCPRLTAVCSEGLMFG